MKTRYLLLTSLLALSHTLYAGENHDDDDAFWADAAALLPGFTGTPAEPGPSNQAGRWGSVINWPHVPVSAASLPNGKILTFSGQERGSWPGTKTQTYWTIYDPVTNRFDESLYLDHEMFCAHLVMRTDGTLQTVGGRYTVRDSSVFDFRSNEWKRVDDMDDRRWYTTSVALPDGDVFTVAGSGGENTSERYSPDNDQWTKLTGIDWQPVSGAAGFESRWWPYLWVAPNGQLFHFGPTEAMHWVNPDGNGQRTSAGISVPNNHYPKHAGVTMYDSGKILVAGGAANTGGGSTNICYTVDLNTNPPTVQQVASMQHPRRFSNAVVLPSGEVMIVGGNTSGKKFNDEGTVLTPEIWNPRTNTWREVADMERPRNYHSVALLLADGRVFAGGNGYSRPNQQNGEIYTPPSLYNSNGQPASRPSITSAPDNVSCGSVFQVQGTANLKKFAAIRLIATTHGLTTDQRYLSLPFSETSSGNYQLVAHPNPNVMVPGYWMLFGLNANGVHSVSKIIHVNETGNAATSGLKGSYFDSTNLTNKKFERIDHEVDFNYRTLSPDTAQLGNDTFSMRWEGWVVPDTTGTYTFYTLSDDGVRLWVDGQQIINNWTLQAPTENSGTRSLTAGQPVPIRMEYYESGGGAVAELRWSGPGTAKQIIPEKNLRSSNPASTATVAVDDVFELYVDGMLVSIGTEWNRAYHSTFSTNSSSVIAIRACNTAGAGSAIGDFLINGERIVTNNQWKVSTTAPTDWNQPAFNDSAWANATDRGGIPSGVMGMPANSAARNIWAANASADEVFLRLTTGAPTLGTVANRADTSGQSVNFTIPVTAASGATLTFTANNFPTGVSINPSTGQITGTLSGQGVFNASVTVRDQSNLMDTINFQWVVRLPGEGSGSILREWWIDIDGASLSDLTSDPRYPLSPTGSEQITSFPARVNFGDTYGSRLRGYLHAPVTGTYLFWLSTDNSGSLLLGSNDSPSSASQIASIPNGGWAGVSDWTKYPEQASVAINLQGGQRYYIEALQKETTGGDHVNIAWRIPGDSGINVIDASYLSPFQPNRAPVLGSLPNRAHTVGQSVNIQLVASDPENDPITFTSSNLPTGLNLASNGQITGAANAANNYNVTITVTDSVGRSDSGSFSWQINPLVTIPDITPSASPSGGEVSYTASPTGGTNPRYKWNFGDEGGDTAYSNSPSITHTYDQPGRYAVTFTATDDSGVEVSSSFVQNIYPQLTADRPTVSQSLLYEERANNDRLWNVNPDNNTVSVFDAVTDAKLAEISVGTSPRSLALASDGNVWVTNKHDGTLSRIRTSDFQVVGTVSLGRGSEPHGLAIDPQGQRAYIALEGSGELAQLNASTGAVITRLPVGPSPRHLSVSADGSKVYLSRFITPAVPGESTASPDVSAAGGELLVLSTTPLAISKTIVLGHSYEPDSGGGGRGIPNYLGPASLSPAGDMAWLPSKQDNILRGALRDGSDLDHDNTVRSISSRIDLLTEVEDQDARVDHDDASVSTTALYGPNGLYVFIAQEGNREVAVIDAYGQQELFRFDVGRAPQGLALSSDGSTLFVHNFMSRTVSAHDITGVIDQGTNVVSDGPVYNAVASETLSTQVLLGKRLFYDARDNRLAQEDYMSCASCHNDGDHDGRVWDFTGFGEGLRNTIDLRGRGGLAHGPLHWSANFDEIQDFENQIRDFAGGNGLISGNPHPPLGTSNAGRSADLDALAAYISSLNTTADSPYREPNGDLSAQAALGKDVFRAKNCAECHSGSSFTDSAPNNLHDIGTLSATSGSRLGSALTGIDTPTLRGLWNGAPFLHDGSAATIAEAVTAHADLAITSAELNQLVAYLQQIDGEETAAPSNTGPALESPGNQTNDVDDTVNLALIATDPNGDTLIFSASNLPTGLTINQNSGIISGATTTAGTFNVTATVDDQLGGTDVVSFTWSVNEVITAENDLLANFTAPSVVQQGEDVVVTVDYESTQSHELWVWMQDSNSGWRTVATDNLTLTPGIGTHTFNLNVADDARVGDGYLWVVRLLPQGWATADDALAADYIQATVQTGTGNGGGDPTQDQLGGVNFPALVTSPGSVTLEVPYEATAPRELRVWLHDPENGWFSIAQGGVVVQRGFGTHVFNLPVLPNARAGSGYVWALRLLPIDWATSDDAIDAAYAEATTERDTGGGNPTNDSFVSVQAPSTVQAAGTTTVIVEYEATARREIGLWLHDVNNGFNTIATEIRTIEPGFGNEVFNLGVASDARLGDGHLWAIRLLPEGWATSDDALDEFYKDVTVQELDSTTDFINLATEFGATATQSSVFGNAFTADLVHDGNTDGDWRNGSVNHTELDLNAWWEIDLGSIQDISHINVWNRTDCCGDEWLSSYHVLVSNSPFDSSDLAATIAQAGVTDYAFNTAPSSTQRVDVNRTGRYVRIQLSGANYLALAEVEIFAPGEVLQIAQQVDVTPTGLIQNQQVTAAANVDGDALDLGTEYALGRDPYTSTPASVLSLSVDEHMSVSYERPTRLGQIRYTLERSQDMVNWESVQGGEVSSSLSYGRDLVIYHDVAPASQGFVRLRIQNYDWNHETVTPTQGWIETNLHQGFQTHGVSVTQPGVIHAEVQAWTEEGLTLSASDLTQRFDAQQPHYLEFTSGTLAGHRIDMDTNATTDTLLVPEWTVGHNTLDARPSEEADWLGASVVIRPHWTLSQVYAKDAFIGGTDPAISDQVLFFNGADYDAYFLLQAEGYHQWVAQNDDNLVSADNLIIPPGVGSFIKRPEDAEPISLLLTGQARDTAFVQPLVSGYNLLASPRPLDVDPTTWGLLLEDGFTGSRDPDTADQIQLWVGDEQPSREGYESYFLLDAGADRQHWTELGPELPNIDTRALLSGDRAFFFKLIGASRPNYRLPALTPYDEDQQ